MNEILKENYSQKSYLFQNFIAHLGG